MNRWEPQLAARAFVPLLRGLEALGHPGARLLAEVGVTADMLDEPDNKVPHTAAMRFWRLAVEQTGDADLGLHVAESAPIESFELHSYALLSCSSLREAFRRGVRYQRLIHEAAELTFEEPDADAPSAVLSHVLQGGLPVPRQSAEFLVATWHRLGCLVVGERWAPSLVRFAHVEPSDIGEHRRLLGDRLRFAQGVNALHVPQELLDRQNPGGDPVLAELLDRYAAELLERAPEVSTLAQRVRAMISERLEEGAPSATQVAQELHMSVRTLHRGLRAEATSYREVLESFRQQRAAELLADRHYSTGDVAFLVGFSELSSFYRAFKRWTGSTPAEVRERSFSRVL